MSTVEYFLPFPGTLVKTSCSLFLKGMLYWFHNKKIAGESNE